MPEAPRPSMLSKVSSALALALFLIPAANAQAGEFVVKSRTTPDMKAMFGQVQSRDLVPARTRIGGTIVSRSVDEGAQVKAGDVLAVVADQKLALQAQTLDGQLNALTSQLENANVSFKRAADLLPRGFTTKAAYDEAKTNVDVLTHQIEAMRSQRAVVAQQMTEGAVLAPKAGEVLTMSAIPGSVVLPGESIARIAAGARYLRLSLPERHAALLKLDAPVLLAPRVADQATANAPLGKGRIAKIYPEIENGRVIADAEVDNLGDYFIGERVQIFAPVGQRQALMIPRAAVSTRAGVDYVRVSRPEGPLDVAIIFADTHQGDMVEALAGLTAGDKVVTP
jgi:RND family efflux transporter MFP subunit